MLLFILKLTSIDKDVPSRIVKTDKTKNRITEIFFVFS